MRRLPFRAYPYPPGQGGNVFDVRAYGAKGDGLTDDLASIDNASEANVAGHMDFWGASGVLLHSEPEQSR